VHTAGHAPGRIVLFGSGETSLAGGRVFESLARTLPAPLRISVLETPAGFELNSDRVAGRVADFLRSRLANYHPDVAVLPARARNTPFSPDSPDITAPLLHADLIFMGPGSPTYAVRQLTGSLAWYRMLARQRVGATLALASAAVIAVGAAVLPIYEIYKAGEDPHWRLGLDLFGVYGLNLVFIPHWNNAEGGTELDTSRCFMGRQRFEALREMLPIATRVIGIDEHTALVADLESGMAEVMGAGSVAVLWPETERRFGSGQRFPLTAFGPFHWPKPDDGLPPEVWREAVSATEAEAQTPEPPAPEEIMALVMERQAARARRDWAAADALRERIAGLGWQVRDAPEGPVVEMI
jgi:cyanophycinase-like exopeptidase